MKKIEPIKEKHIKTLAELEAIYEASQDKTKANTYPIFRLNGSPDPQLWLCNRQEIGDDGPEGYVFYTPEESAAYGDWEHYVEMDDEFVDMDGEIDPDDLIYTGQNFIEGQIKLESENQDFIVSVDGKETNYYAFKSEIKDLEMSEEIVLGAWYFYPEDPGMHATFPFSDGYKTLQDAKDAAEEWEITQLNENLQNIAEADVTEESEAAYYKEEINKDLGE